MKPLLVVSVIALIAAAPAAMAQEEHRPGGGGAPHAPAGHPAGPPAAARPMREPGPAMGARPSEGFRPEGGRSEAVRPEGAARPEHVRPSVGERPASHAAHTGARAGVGTHAQGAHAQGAHAQGAHAQGAANAQHGAAASAAGRHGASAAARSPAVAALRRNVQATHRFHVGGYQAPAGYVARHWSYGQRLPGAYYARNYWLLNYFAYGLFGPPPGLVWVRVGYDALLIDQYSGEIVQVDYGVFY